MKKQFIYALMSAFALMGTVAFSSCSSTEDETVNVNPGYNEATGEVPVNFVFNVGYDYSATTRMSESIAQYGETPAFRGIDVGYLMSNKLNAPGPLYTVEASTATDKWYNLGTIFAENAIGPNSQENSRRVLELSLPVGTNNIMFWGKAKRSFSTTTYSPKTHGQVDFTVDKTLANTSFKLTPRMTADMYASFYKYQEAIAAILNTIMKSKFSGSVTYDGSTLNIPEGTPLKWSDFVVIDNSNKLVAKTTTPLPDSFNGGNSSNPSSMSALGEILANAFVTFNTINPNELRAGSGSAVERMLKDLYTVINKVAGATPTTLQEAVAKALGNTIKTNINHFMNEGNSWKPMTNLIGTEGALIHYTSMTSVDGLSVSGEFINFPSVLFNLPQGATILKCEIDKEEDATVVKEVKYSYNNSIPTYDMGGGATGTFDIERYMWPAELCYFGNSPIRVTNDTHTVDDFPNGTTKWMTEAQWGTGVNNNTVAWTKNGSVLSSTRSVAMQENINYGSALLKAQVKYGVATLNDNNSGLHPGEGDQTITVDDNTFKLTGISIGGQEQEMGWNYIAKSASPSFNVMIYDNSIPNTTIPAYTEGGAWSAPNYTLVWDNWNPGKIGDKQNVVYVALEFLNNSGRDFWGENNLIRDGGTFYITAMLDPDNYTGVTAATDRSLGVAWPDASATPSTAYALPPYDGSGNTIKQRRVFIQDYVTEATFVIGANSLKHALVAVPDLREAQMSVGLSVDMKWSAGLKFSDVELGGTTTP